MGSPYREQPRFLSCPRCGEPLDRAFEGVSPCLRCDGLWIASATLAAAFGNTRWPEGHAMWWRNSIECPQCALEGKGTLLTARMSNDVVVDQCAEHGLWLDRGELGRLMGIAGDELGALRARLAATAPDAEQRQSRRADFERRRREVFEYRQALDEEHRRRIATSAAEPDRLDADTEVGRLRDRLAALRDHIRRLEDELADTRQRTADTEQALDAAHADLTGRTSDRPGGR